MSVKSLTTLLLAGLLTLNIAAKASSDVLFIADFNKGNQNALGGYFNKYERNPSKAAVSLDSSVFHSNHGKSLKISAKKDKGGFCGAWIHLFDFRADSKKFLDTSEYKYLSFWVKGKQGGEMFTVKLADKRLIEVEDSAKVGAIKDFLPDGVTQEWQEVLLPLDKLGPIDKTQLGGITFDFNSPGNYVVYIDDIILKKTKETTLASTKKSDAPESTAVVTPTREVPPRTLWVWTVFEILKNKNDEQDKVFELCERENVNRLWLQVPAHYEPSIDMSANIKDIQPPKFKVSLLHERKLRKFIRKAHKRGIKVEALDGYPEFAQKPYHFIPLAIVDAIIDYNKRAKPEERFVGVHFDNEPYLIIGWHDKKRRERILREFLELNVECQRRIRENSDMEFGIDVPFWWNAPDPKSEGAIGDVTFNGERKPAVYFCIDLLDNIGIMNYRDTTYGVDGIIAHADPILNYAQKVGKDSIYVGLEVFRYMPTEAWFPFGLPRNEFSKALQTKADDLGYLSRINGFRTQLIDDGVNVHVGIEVPNNPDDATRKKMNDTLTEIGRYLGVIQRNNDTPREMKKGAMYIQQEISKNPEWENYGLIDIVDVEELKLYPGFKATSIMLGKTTFADESYTEFKEQLDSSESELVDRPAFRSTAIHYLKVLDEKFHEQ